MPLYGRTLDLFTSMDSADLPTVLGLLHRDVHGAIRFPDTPPVTFASRAEFEVRVAPILSTLREAGVHTATRVLAYDASTDPATVLASIDLEREIRLGATVIVHRGHATLAWSVDPDGRKSIVQWRITWENVPRALASVSPAR